MNTVKHLRWSVLQKARKRGGRGGVLEKGRGGGGGGGGGWVVELGPFEKGTS